MPTASYNINFTPKPGSYGTLIEYRADTSPTWITPTTPSNPTAFSTYPLTLTKGVTYNVRLSSIFPNCTINYGYITIIVPEASACCPPGYTLSPDSTYCYQEQDVPATPPTSSENAVGEVNMAYSTCGSYIYSPGWLSNGTGASTQISLSNNFWKNGGTCADNTTTDGPLNRAGLWATTALSNQDIGFSVCITPTSTKTYYIGLGCDNYAIINIDGVNVITQDPTALGIQYGVGIAATFKVWHIYPITLSAGPHIVQLIGHNITGVAALGAEVYDNTSAEIIAATSYGGLNLLFSTKDYIGQPIQFGTDGIGYTCPSGYTLSCGSPFVCKKIVTTSIIEC